MIRFYVFIICLYLWNCAPKDLSPQELRSFILEKENGLQQTAKVRGMAVSVTYRPVDLLVHQEVDDGVVDKATIDSLRKKYSNYYYFILSISRSEEEALHMLNDMNAYSQLVEVMSFRMPQYVTLTTTSQDTIRVGDFVMNRTYGLGSSTDILFAFNKEKVRDNKWVQFNLNEFGLGLGNQRFRFPTNDLNEAPQVRFNTVKLDIRN